MVTSLGLCVFFAFSKHCLKRCDFALVCKAAMPAQPILFGSACPKPPCFLGGWAAGQWKHNHNPWQKPSSGDGKPLANTVLRGCAPQPYRFFWIQKNQFGIFPIGLAGNKGQNFCFWRHCPADRHDETQTVCTTGILFLTSCLTLPLD